MAIYLLVTLSKLSEQLPPQLWVYDVTAIERNWIYSGGFANVHKATYAGQSVAIKRLRFSDPSHRLAVYKARDNWLLTGVRSRSSPRTCTEILSRGACMVPAQTFIHTSFLRAVSRMHRGIT
jgi:hypothetical protein